MGSPARAVAAAAMGIERRLASYMVAPSLDGIVATRQEVFFFGTPPGDKRYDFGSMPVWVHIGERFVYGIPGHERRGLKLGHGVWDLVFERTT